MISVLLADDQDLVLMGLRTLFDNEEGYVVDSPPVSNVIRG